MQYGILFLFPLSMLHREGDLVACVFFLSLSPFSFLPFGDTNVLVALSSLCKQISIFDCLARPCPFSSFFCSFFMRLTQMAFASAGDVIRPNLPSIGCQRIRYVGFLERHQNRTFYSSVVQNLWGLKHGFQELQNSQQEIDKSTYYEAQSPNTIMTRNN